MKNVSIVAVLILIGYQLNAQNVTEMRQTGSVWPPCKEGQIEVMLLGTFHMANPGADAVNVVADDMTSDMRQTQIQELVNRLVEFNPGKIMVEWNYKDSLITDSLYQTVDIDTLLMKYRDETIQIAFRMGNMLGHNRIYPIDYRMSISSDSLTALRNRIGGSMPYKLNYTRLNPGQLQQESDERLRNSTILEYYNYINGEEPLRNNHIMMFGALRYGKNGNFGGADMLANWYKRNFRIVHNIWRNVEPGDEKVFVLMGAGHIRSLRHILDEAPQFCPVSPMPYLTGE